MLSQSSVLLELPYPPSVNHYKKAGALVTTKNGKLYQRRINTDETKQYYWQVWAKIRSQGVKSLGSATIDMTIGVYPPDKRKRDLDGILKVLLDSMQRAGLFDDDYQVAKLLVERCSVFSPEGKVIVSITQI